MSGAIQLEEIDTEAFKDRYGKLAVSVAPTPKVAAGWGIRGSSARRRRCTASRCPASIQVGRGRKAAVDGLAHVERLRQNAVAGGAVGGS